MTMEIPLRQSLSVTSIAEFSEPISETDEIESVRLLQKLGDKAFKKHDYSRASACYKEALEIDADNVQLLAKSAVSNIELKDYDEAKRDAEILVKLNPHVPQGHYLLAVCLDNLGEYGPAITSFLRALKHDQDHQAQLVDNVAVVAANICLFSEATLQQLEDSSPIEKLMLVAESLYECQQYGVCIHVQHTIQDLKQANEEIQLKSQYLLAMCYHKHEELDRALDHFHTLLSQALGHKNSTYEASAYHNLAQLSMKGGQIQQGIVFYEKLLSICEDLKDETGQESEAEDSNLDYLVRDRLQKHVHEILSSAYRAASDLSQALFHADKYLHQTVLDGEAEDQEVRGKAYLLVGFLREGLGDYATALKHYQECFTSSKTNNDRPGMARAYGCLGRVYHKLCNFPLAQSYYEQQLVIAEKFKYLQMVTAASRSLAKLFVDQHKHDEAYNYLEKYLRVSRKLDEFFTECEALLDIGDFYHGQGRLFQSEYYYEQAFVIAQRSKLPEQQHRAASKLAEVLVHSEDIKNVEKARFLCEESIKFCQELWSVHQEEGSNIPEALQQCLEQSYAILKTSLCKLKRNLEALEHAECQNSHFFQEILTKQARDGVMDNKDPLNFQDICKLVNSQSSSVVYYDVTDRGILIWVLKPNEGCIYFVRTLLNKARGKTSTEHLQELVSAVHCNDESMCTLYDCEFRALPLLDSETHKIQMFFKSLSRSYSASSRTPSRTSSKPETPSPEAMVSPLQELYNILWEPICGHVCEGEVIVIATDVLAQLSFDSLTDADGLQLGETHRITSIPSVKVLQHMIQNQPNINDLYLADSVEGQTRQGSDDHSKPTSPIYLDHMLRVVIPPASLPHHPIRDTMKLAPKMAATAAANPSHVAFGTNHQDSVPDYRDPMLGMEERRVREGCERGSTLISKTWSGSEVPSAKGGQIVSYSQRRGRAGIVVMGNPTLPEKMRVHGKMWKPKSELAVAQEEIHKVADYLNTDPLLGSKVTKSAILSQLPTATIIHLAMYGSWEDGVLLCTPNPTTKPLEDGEYSADSYQINTQDVMGMSLCSQLVVLSCCYGNRHRPLHLDLPLAFIAAGAQCVLLMLWAVNDLVRDKFWHHFYLALGEGTMVSTAVHAAKQAIKQDNRFQDARHWAAFHLIGFDQYINLVTIKHALLDRTLNETEKLILNSMKEDGLNLREDDPQDMTEVAVMQKLCSQLSLVLIHHINHPQALPCILKLLETGKKLLDEGSSSTPPSLTLPAAVLLSPAATPLLALLGFHFQPQGPTNQQPFVVFPSWDPDSMIPPALQAVQAMMDVSINSECCHCLAQVLAVHDKLTSGLVDILAITKHMPEVQLRANDSGIQNMWVQNTARALLQSLGFKQIGKLILFDGSKTNKKQLFAVLQVLCAISGEKGNRMLHHLDMRFLGIAATRLASKSPRQSPAKSARLLSSSTIPRLTATPSAPVNRLTATPSAPVNRLTATLSAPVNRLRTLNPVVLPGNKMDFSSPWWCEEPQEAEVREKMRLAKSLSDVNIDFSRRMKSNRRWHLEALDPKAQEEREKIGLPAARPRKIKMKGGGSPSVPRVPVDHIEPLSAEALEQRRDYAHFLSRVRSMDIEKRHRHTVQQLFLPYVNNNKKGV